MSAAIPLFSPTLDGVQKAFNHWRATHGKRTQTPGNVQRRAAELAPAPEQVPAEHAAFVTLPTLTPSDTLAPSIDTAYPISIDLGDSIALRMHGSFTPEQILCAIGQHQQGVST